MSNTISAKDKKYYWLKLHKDFFKRHDIKIIEAMPNGKEYVLFYLKLLCESTDHDGHLRFNSDIPYTSDMLATITGTNPDIARTAIDVFRKLDFIEIMEDGTLNMLQMDKMIGSETYWAKRKREQRLKTSADQTPLLPENANNWTLSNDCPERPSKSKSKSKNIYSASSSDARQLFEKLWQLYPKKKGKNQIKLTKQKELLKVGEAAMVKAIERYSAEIEGKDIQYVLNGNTFFNGRYLDYLDGNYEEPEPVVKKNEHGW